MSQVDKKRKMDDSLVTSKDEKILELEAALFEKTAELVEKDKEMEELKKEVAELKAKVDNQDKEEEEDLSDDETELDPNNPWDAKCMELRQFRMINGHCNVPRSVPGLGSWVNNQRYTFTKGKLSQERIIILEAIGFNFGKGHPPAMTFEEGLEELKKFKKGMGHCNIFVDPKNPSRLAKWCGVQRSEYKRFRKQTDSLLDLDKIAELREVGFKFKTPARK